MLVWAKIRGFPYWPGKILRILNGDLDVRFFGAHDRALVQPVNSLWLSKDYPATSIARSNNSFEFKFSLSELKVHIDRLMLRFGSFNYAPIRTPVNLSAPFVFINRFTGL